MKTTLQTRYQQVQRFLFDTVYNEPEKKVYLYFSTGEKIDYDRLVNQENIPGFIFSGLYSPDSGEFGEGLFIYPTLNEIKANSIIIGTWKNLDEKELDYKVDPRARFRYNIFSNPDAAVAIFYKNILIKGNEKVSFGTVLSTSKLPSINIKQVNILQSVKNVEENKSAGLNTQVDIFDRISKLIDKIDLLLGSTNLTPVPEAESSLGKGLSKAVSKNSLGNPFDNAKTASSTSPQPAVNAQVSTQPQAVYTNVLNTGISQKDVENLMDSQRDERLKLQKRYEDKINSLQDYYQSLLKQRENEFKDISSDYKQKIEEREKIKLRNQKIDDINSTIISLDKKIDVIEQLLSLHLDFESMPEGKIEEINNVINDIEKKLKQP